MTAFQELAQLDADHVMQTYGRLPVAFVRGEGTLLWDSGPYFPANYTFETFYLGDPHTAAPPLGPSDGYLWELRCWNTDGGEKGATMWGTMQ